MRILFIDDNLPFLIKDDQYPVGGWTVELAAWLAGLRGAGHLTAVVTWVGARAHAGSDAVEFVEARVRRGIPIVKFVFGTFPRLVSRSLAFRPDVIVQACAGFNTGLMAVLAKILRVPFVYRVANDIDVDWRYRTRMGLLSRVSFTMGLNLADGFVCQNEYQITALAARFPMRPRVKIYNPFQPRGNASDEDISHKQNYIAWVGVFQPQKNLPRLLRIARSLPAVEFRVAGMPERGGSGRAADEAIAGLKRLKNVKFVGYLRRDEISTFLMASRALLSTSDYEGFSNTFLEAWFAGTPVVALDAVDPDHLISRHGLGLVGDTDASLAEAVSYITALGDCEYRAMSRACRAHVAVEYSPVGQAMRLVEYLADGIHRSREI